MIHRIWQQKGVLPSVLLDLRNSDDPVKNREYKFMIASERFELELAEKESQ